jgi:hypothetical protein
MNLPTTRRAAAAVAIVVAGYVHLVLYRRSYHAVPHVGTLFALDVVAAAGAAAAVAVVRARASDLVALAHASTAAAGFLLSRTVGLWGFKEEGLDPAPDAAIAIGAELAAVVLLTAGVVRRTRSVTRRAGRPA